MKILSTKIKDNSQVFEIEVDASFWKEEFAKTKKNIAKNISVQGFRKGHVPANIIDERVSPEQVAYQTLDKNQNAIITDIIHSKEFEKSNCLDAVNKLEVIKLSGDKAPVLKVSFDLVPKVEGFKKEDLKKISIPPYKAKPLAQSLIDQQIKMMIKPDAMVSVKKGVIAKGDIAVIDFTGFKDGKEFAGGKAKDYELEIGSKSFIDNFEDQLIGLKKGDKKDVKVSFPKNYHVKDLAGAPVKFEVVIKDVKSIEYPEINKQYLTKFKIDAKDKKGLEDYLKNLFDQENQMQYQEASMRIIQAEIGKKAKLNYYPASLIAMHKRQVLANYEQEAKNRGFKTLATYKKALGLKDDAFDLIVNNSAKSLLDVSMVFEKLIEEFKLKVEEDDKKEQLSRLARYLGDEAKAKEAYDRNKDYMDSVIIREKLFKKLIAEVKKEEPKPAKKEQKAAKK